MTDQEIYRHFGVKKPTGLVRTEAYEKLLSHLRDAIEDQEWFSIWGEIGSGKTVSMYNALREINAGLDRDMFMVEAYNPERAEYKIGDIYNDLIYSAGPEFLESGIPKRDKAQRIRQIQRMLFAARTQKKVIVLVLDEAHELHANTIKQIKRLREMPWNGMIVSFPIVLLGQPPLRNKVENDIEIGPRTQVVEFKPTTADLAAIVQHYTCGLLSDEDCRRVADAFKRSHSIRQACRRAMEKVAFIGRSTLAFEDFDAPMQYVPVVPTRRKRAAAQLPADLAAFKAAAGGQP